MESTESRSFVLSAEEVKSISPKNTLNINIGVLGHIDSGKTSLAKVLSQITSTAALDKNPQSVERGITLDLGFSAFFTVMPNRFREQTKQEYIQFTLVDCPGHASLIKTIIGGASIIDIMFLVIDVNKGIQTQTAECLVIGELLMQKMIVVLNKIDMIPEADRQETLKKKTDVLRKVFSKTKFGANLPIIPISASPSNDASGSTVLHIGSLIQTLLREIELPKRRLGDPFFFLIDHCFAIKGKGSVVTGTVISGEYKAGEEVEFPLIKEVKKSKSIQMFKKPVDSIMQGDRAGILFAQLDPTLIERGIACTPGFVTQISFCIIPVNKVSYFKHEISSKGKFHVTTGHQTCMATIKLFRDSAADSSADDAFDYKKQFEYVESYQDFSSSLTPTSSSSEKLFALLEFEKPAFVQKNALLICSKLDTDITANLCRIAFFGNIKATLTQQELKNKKLVIYRRKFKQGIIEKVTDNYNIIIKDMFSKESNIEIFKNSQVSLTLNNAIGKITGAFGKSGKVKATFPNSLTSNSANEGQNEEVEEEQKIGYDSPHPLVGTIAVLKYQKILFNK